MKVTRALLSVYDKTGVADFAERLHRQGVELVSTGGTAELLRKDGLPVKDVSEVTGFPEMMDGRVKTLHPKVLGGVLADRTKQEHLTSVEEHGIAPFDLICVNLYPFEETAASGADLPELIEQIDIGGPTLIRSAAKNNDHVFVVTDPNQYERVAEAIEHGDIAEDTKLLRRELALRAFQETARYDAIISRVLSKKFRLTDYPEHLVFAYDRRDVLRYGENSHQRAAYYEKAGPRNVIEPSIIRAEQLHGKQLSYNNILDADLALESVKEFSEKPCCVIIKHATPCGIAMADTLHQAWTDALACDPYSPFGGVVAMNRPVTKDVADELSKLFLEIVVAPDFDDEALERLKKKKNLRLLKVPGLDDEYHRSGSQIRSITGGLLVQDRDLKPYDTDNWTVAGKVQPSDDQMDSMLFAARCVKAIRSNAVVFVQGTKTVGIGGGQTARVDSTFIAAHKGGENIQGSVMASDAFFPFRDAVDVAAEKGVQAIVQPGGSIRDEEVIEAADEHGIAMVFSGQRSFRH